MVARAFMTRGDRVALAKVWHGQVSLPTSSFLAGARNDRFAGVKKLTAFRDYRAQIAIDFVKGTETAIELPSSNVLAFEFEGGGTQIIRPSGPEPQIKLYYATAEKTREESRFAYEALSATVQKYLGLSANN
jgi:phosphomannomutase